MCMYRYWVQQPSLGLVENRFIASQQDCHPACTLFGSFHITHMLSTVPISILWVWFQIESVGIQLYLAEHLFYFHFKFITVLAMANMKWIWWCFCVQVVATLMKHFVPTGCWAATGVLLVCASLHSSSSDLQYTDAASKCQMGEQECDMVLWQNRYMS